MANIIEFNFQIKDMASAQIRSLANSSESVFNRIGSRLGRIQGQVRRLDEAIEALAKPREIDIDTSKIRMASKELAELENQRSKFSTEIKMAGKELAHLQGERTGLAKAVASASEQGKKSEKKKDEPSTDWLDKGMEKLMGFSKTFMARQAEGNSIEIMAGSKGGKLKNDLNTFADQNGLGEDVFKASRKMLASGIAPENILPGLKMIGDIAEGDADRMKALADVFADTAAAGKLTPEDVPKFIEAGYNPMLEMSKLPGKNMGSVTKDLADGKISFQSLVDTMQVSTDMAGNFNKGMEHMAETPAGKIAALQGTIQSLAMSIGKILLPILDAMTDVFNVLANQPMMAGIAAGIATIAVAMAAFSTWTEIAATWQLMLDAALAWPILIIAGLVGAIVWLGSSFDGVTESMSALWRIIKSVFGIGKAMFMEFADNMLFPFKLLYITVKNIILFIGQLIANAGKAIGLALSGHFSAAKDVLLGSFTSDIGKELGGAIHDRVGRTVGRAKEIIGYGKTIYENAKEIHISRKTDKKESSTGWNKSLVTPPSLPSASPGGTTAAVGAAPNPPGTVTETSKGISEGGQRNQVINIAKLGVDQISLHAASVTEGAAEIRAIFIEMFNQVINSGNAAVNPN